jgi:hypothetical protein
MSAALADTIESLHIAAARKLLDLIQTEKDPHLLAWLIATAFRFKPAKRGTDDPPHQPRQAVLLKQTTAKNNSATRALRSRGRTPTTSTTPSSSSTATPRPPPCASAATPSSWT